MGEELSDFERLRDFPQEYHGERMRDVVIPDVLVVPLALQLLIELVGVIRSLKDEIYSLRE